ncbi:TPA: hypothetical protein ACKFQ2_001102 [Citrobacter amalonaticus]
MRYLKLMWQSTEIASHRIIRSIFTLAMLVLFLNAASASATVIHCESQPRAITRYHAWPEIYKATEVNVDNIRMSLPLPLSEWAVIYTAENHVIDLDVGVCDIDGLSPRFTLLTATPAIAHQGNDYIYATNVPGIGISVAESFRARYHSLQPYPLTDRWDEATPYTHLYATIKYWKIPGQNIPSDAGTLTVIGPEVGMVYEKSGYSFTSSETNRITREGRAYINDSRIIKATIFFQPPTCDIKSDHVSINMGDYDGTAVVSRWKDASFTIRCPASFDDRKHKIQFTMIPVTRVLDIRRGIIAPGTDDAHHYGIQLAWGDYQHQPSGDPAMPVRADRYVEAHELIKGYSEVDGLADSESGHTIRMAARAIRISGDEIPGPVSTVIQVIAYYR